MSRYHTIGLLIKEERDRCAALLRAELEWWGYDSDNVSNWPTAYIVERLEKLLEAIERGTEPEK